MSRVLIIEDNADLAFGVVTAVFEKGWGASRVGLEGPVAIVSYVPLMMFAVLFGLSMDYEVFLMSHVREAWQRTKDNRLAVIEGIGSSTLRIQGKPRLEGAVHTVLPDRIETGTFAFAVAATGGDVVLEGTRRDLLKTAFDTLAATGATVADTETGVRITRNGNGLQPVDVETQPFPGFPTDLQAQLMALMTRAHGTSVIRETIFENRFMHVQELARLGADIKLHGDTATIKGVKSLTGAPVMATDLRASVSLVIAGLMAEGETMINRVYHLDRGFERLEEKLSGCGAVVERLSG